MQVSDFGYLWDPETHYANRYSQQPNTKNLTKLVLSKRTATCVRGIPGHGLCCRSAHPHIEPCSHSWHGVRLVKGVRLQQGRFSASAWCSGIPIKAKIKVGLGLSSKEPFLLIGLGFFFFFCLVLPFYPALWTRRVKFCLKTDCLCCKQKAEQSKTPKCGFFEIISKWQHNSITK